MLEIGDLTVSYGQHRALEGASLRVAKGEIVVMLGANGAGKSTLLKAVAGICEGRVSGAVTLDGEALLGLPPDRIVEAGIALVPEGRGIFADLNVRENLMLGAFSHRAREESAQNLDRVLTLFPRLGERMRQQVRTMSGGEQQMVAIGRAMMSAPQILMLDEPSLGLSPLLSKGLFQSLRAVREAGIGILLVEQNARASLAVADRGYLLENGAITHADSAARLAGDPAVQAAYLGGKGTAGATSRPAPVPAAASAPPRPAAGADPNAIAAQAMAAFKPAARPDPARSAPPSAAPPAAPPQPRPATPVTGAARPAPTTPAGPGATDRLLGISIDDLVAGAAARSRASVSGAGRPAPALHSNGAAPRPMPKAPPAPPREAPPPRDTDSRTRLAQVLAEIEQAAARAESWRAPGPARKP